MYSGYSHNILVAVVTVLLLPVSVLAQTGNQPLQEKSLTITRTAQPPVIDGILDDAVWQQLPGISDFHQVNPVDQGTPTQESIFYITYDDDYFYLGARLYDSNPEAITSRVMIQGQSLRFDDNVHLILDTFNNDRTGFRFITNPNAIRDDGVFESPTSYNIDWSGIWLVESSINDQGWTTEMAIPFTTLNFDPETDTWGINFEREIARNNERIAWSSFNRAIDPSTSGQVVGLEGLEQGLGLDIVPSLTVGQARDRNSNTTEDNVEPSLDVFYKFTPNLTGVLTLNTDFSATEVDDRQVNLTRFNLFFPEKRDFFLQDSEIFSFGSGGNNGIPFYSRRIGLDASTGQPVDIDVGGKLAGRVGDTSLGALLVQQEDRIGASDDPLFVGRVTQNVLTESRVGAIFTQGNPNGLADNSVAGVDFNYRNTRFADNYTLTGDIWYQQSDTDGLEGDDKAYSAAIDLATEGNGFSGELDYNYIGAEYNPALGFANRRGVDQINGRATYRHYPEDHPLLWYYYAHLDISRTDRLDNGQLQSEALNLRYMSLNSHAGDRIYAEVFREKEGLVADFAIRPGVVIPAGEYAFTSHAFGLQTANQRSLSPDIGFTIGDFYTGEQREVDFGLDWQPGPRFSGEFSYVYTDIDLPQGEFVSRLVRMRSTFSFTPEWSWINLLQYDNGSDSVGLNSRLHWDPRAGEDFYLVVNYNFDADGVFNGLNTRQSEIVLKYSRNFRF
ncbi:MAG: hypothetical protein CMP91_08640 [Gammaproteobacteria bacterium]|nr:hypothetical protein [Gammaproteobacteria bacterium]